MPVMKAMRAPLFYFGITVCAAYLASCSTSPTGRKQLMLVSDQEMDQMGEQAFLQAQQQTPPSSDAKINSYIDCVVLPLTQAAQNRTQVKNWQVKVLQSDQVNAFALPGGSIGVYSGLLKVAQTQGQLATVVGHEIGHVIARHGNERVSTQLAEQGGLSVVQAFLGGAVSPAQNQLIMAALGVGAQVGIALPFSRTQESEADVIGLKLMAQAGFDPHQSIQLWENMAKASGGQAPPEILSSHPADQKRIENLQAHMPEALELQKQARAAGKNPHCAL